MRLNWKMFSRYIQRSAVLLMLTAAGTVRAQSYDPLAVDPSFHAKHIDLSFNDTKRNRNIPLRIYLPTNTTPQPVILFSHGLGGSREGSMFLGEQWAARGYVAVFVQHPGSDESIWKGKPPAEVMPALRKAASRENFMLRVQDISAVLDTLAVWNSKSIVINPPDTNGILVAHMDLTRVGMSGHSFGAITTEAVSGESFPFGRNFTDPRIKAAIIFSPSSPAGGTPDKAFSSVKIPWMLMTGTKDVAPIGDQTMELRLKVYPALQGAPKYQVVLFNAEHSVFTDRALPGDHEPRNPNHHRVILALSTAFWDACLRGDTNALAWLNGSGPRSVMETQDQWQLSAP
jgi:predicted dienelactone hydrolase